MVIDVFAHELSQNLRGRTILPAAGFEELLSKFLFNTYAKTRIFHHRASVPNGYTSAENKLIDVLELILSVIALTCAFFLQKAERRCYESAMTQSCGKFGRGKTPSPSSSGAIAQAVAACPRHNLLTPPDPQIAETARRAGFYDEVRALFERGLLGHEVLDRYPDEQH